MDPAVIGARLASGVVAPLIKKLFVREGPGAGLVDRPVRLSGLVSFRGEKRTLTEKDLAKLAGDLVHQALRTGERAITADERQAVVDALARTLHALGDLSLSDVEAVELGHTALAARLRDAADAPERGLSADATYFYERLLDTTCLHILQFFTQRSTFVAATLVAQSRRQDELIAKVDELIARSPLPGAEDVAFEQRYLAYVAKKHGKLTIFGIDLANSPGRWPLDAAYMSLEATERFGKYQLQPQEVADALADAGPAYAQWADQVDESAPTSRPADQALADHDRVLLRGEAGSGKTTLAQWLAVSATGGTVDDARMAYLYDRIPYVLPLRTLTRHGERLPAPADFLSAVGSPLAGTQPKGWESRVLAAGRALILVDGIDEIPDSERTRTRAWLSDLIDAYPGNRWLVTSRPSAIREDWLAEQGFTELTLLPMSRSEVAAFIHRWHGAARTGTPEEDEPLLAYEGQLLEAVGVKPDLGRLATNPLMCGLICALHRDRRGFLPLGRKDLYSAALSMLLIRRDRERDMHVPELREEPQLQLLQRLAYWLLRNGRTVMDRSRAESIIADALPAVPELAALGDARAVFGHFLHRSGLLREPGRGTVDFIHRTFQDFLGARAALDNGDFGVLARHATDDQWADVIRMAVAQARPRERVEILRELIGRGDRDPDDQGRKRVHLLAAACLEHAAELTPGVRREVEQRMAALIPPVGPQEARALAKVGTMVLDLLPGPEGLNEFEAREVTITATHVQSEAAIPFLARFAQLPHLGVRSQLMWAWHRYECRPYAEQIIAHLDDGETHFTIHSDEQAAELERLGLRPKHLDIRAGVSPAVASRLLTTCEPTLLTLMICPADLTTEALDALSGLEHLRLSDIQEPWSLAMFPADAPVRSLELIRSHYYAWSPHAFERWVGLEEISFGDGSPDSVTEWEALTRLPRLTYLELPSESLAGAPAGLSLPGITDLQLSATRDWHTAMRRIGQLLPGVKRIAIEASNRQGPLDVAPLAHHPTLENLQVPVPPAVGLDALPARISLAAYLSVKITD
ncbi:NACHT domain-containing protein [Streptomyces sp. NPDC056486]|uniref:NACHT domain-containing protein n=1 Tax=Streptomyces sp. NPDC056486 TaxID=3345835 RepID=UPI0036A67D07